jgi:hypothetical protein
VLDSFVFFGGPGPVPATVSLTVHWKATGEFVQRGSGKKVAPTDRAAFKGRFARARSTGRFSGVELGFSFETIGKATTSRGYALIGRERNGSFL